MPVNISPDYPRNAHSTYALIEVVPNRVHKTAASAFDNDSCGNDGTNPKRVSLEKCGVGC